MVTLEGIFLWNYHPYREAEGLVRERVGHWTILRAVATPVPDTKSNPIQRAGPSVWPERFARGLDKNVDLWSPSALGLVLFGKGSNWKLSIRLHSC